tara:strand:- start:257 stop:574 length:318 start_codon:yes stop_codon:yes gene_type:complete
MDMNIKFEDGGTTSPEKMLEGIKESLFGHADFPVEARGEAGLLIFYMSLLAPTPTSEEMAKKLFGAILELVDIAKLESYITPEEAYRMIIKGWETRKGIVEHEGN